MGGQRLAGLLCLGTHALLTRCLSNGILSDELVLIQGQEAALHAARGQQQPRPSPKDRAGVVSLEVAAGVIAWIHEGIGQEFQLRETLFKLNSNNFLKHIEQVCLMAPTESRVDCGRNAAQRLACPVLLRAASALVAVPELEPALLSQQGDLLPAMFGRGSPGTNISAFSPGSPAAGGLAAGAELAAQVPVTLRPCVQLQRGKELLGLTGRLANSPAVKSTVLELCRGRGSDPDCPAKEGAAHVCSLITHATMIRTGPERLARQMAYLLGTHDIVIGKNQFDIVDEPCKTPWAIARSILLKFAYGVLVMLGIYCCLATFCCALWKL